MYIISSGQTVSGSCSQASNHPLPFEFLRLLQCRIALSISGSRLRCHALAVKRAMLA